MPKASSPTRDWQMYRGMIATSHHHVPVPVKGNSAVSEARHVVPALSILIIPINNLEVLGVVVLAAILNNLYVQAHTDPNAPRHGTRVRPSTGAAPYCPAALSRGPTRYVQSVSHRDHTRVGTPHLNPFESNGKRSTTRLSLSRSVAIIRMVALISSL